VLEGEQGTGKSTALRYLFGDRFFIDHLPDFHSKDSFQQLQGAWCVEVAELSALSKADVKDVKQFLSRLVDKFRPPFGTLPIQVPRRTVFWGTVNPEEGGYLRDPTGARRFWPIETNARSTLTRSCATAISYGPKPSRVPRRREVAPRGRRRDRRREG
jgi:putative DNA primase/helicase